MPTSLHVPGGYGILFRRTEYWVRHIEGPPALFSPRGWDPGVPVPMSAYRMTTVLQGHLRAAGMLDHFTTLHSFRVGGSVSKSLASSTVGEILKIEGWRTEILAKYYIGSTTSTRVPASKRKRDDDHATASELPLTISGILVTSLLVRA